MKEIPLTQGKVALVDDEDFEWLSQWKWHCHGDSARRKGRVADGCPRQDIFMHTQILGLPRGTRFRHKDGNGLNNQRHNLEPIIASELRDVTDIDAIVETVMENAREAIMEAVMEAAREAVMETAREAVTKVSTLHILTNEAEAYPKKCA